MLSLIHLLHRIRDAVTAAELAFIAVNETAGLLSYRQAVLWEEGRGLLAISGVPEPEANAPFTLFLERLIEQPLPPGPVDPAMLPPDLRAEWSDWLPDHGFLLVLPKAKAGLLVARDGDWSEQDAALLAELAHAYDHALAALRRPTLWAEWKRRLQSRRKVLVWAAVGGGLAALFPVPLTVLAPAEVVAAHPAVIRSPLDGVVKNLHVRPNQRVAEGALLFELDDTTLRGKGEVAAKALDAAEAELRQVSQMAVFDPAAKPKLAAIIGRREQQAAELEYLHGLLERIRVKAPSGGIAVLDDPSEWIGRPVGVGEKVMALAEENDTEIEAWLSPADAIPLGEGAAVTMFLNIAPLSPVSAKLLQVAYEATPRPDGSVAHRVRARIDGSDKPRLGLKGTARLSGPSVPLIYWLLRKPIGAIRQAVGL
jgi:hypothetical protein